MQSLRRRPRVLSLKQEGVGLNDCRCVYVERRANPRQDILYGCAYGGSSLSLIDCTDPRSLTTLKVLTDDALFRANGVWAGRWGDEHYAIVACGGDEEDFRSQLTAVRTTDPVAAEVVSTVVDTTALGGARKVQVLDKRAYVAGQRGDVMGVVDVRDPLNMAVLGYFTAPWLDILHGAEPYKVTVGDEERIWVAVASASNVESVFGLLDATDPENITELGHLSGQVDWDGNAGAKLMFLGGRIFAVCSVANNDGVPVVEIAPDGSMLGIVVSNHRDEIQTSSPQHVEVIRDGDGYWVLIAAQNQTPLPGGFDGAVVTFRFTVEAGTPALRWVHRLQIANTAWRTSRHLHAYSPNRVALALKSGNAAAIIESPLVAPRYISNLRDPADLPAGRANDWNAASLALSAADSVQTWPNDADGANPLVQPTAGSRPTFRRLRAGGHPAVEFDGATDHMKTTDLNPANYSRPRSVVAIVSFSSVAPNADSTFGSPRILASGVVNAAVQWLIAGRNPAGTFNEIRLTSDGTLSSVAVMPLGSPLVVVLTIDGTTARLVVGGFAEATGTIGSHIPEGYTLGAEPNGFSPLQGLVYRVADYARAFSAAEINHAGRHGRVRYGAAWKDVST